MIMIQIWVLSHLPKTLTLRSMFWVSAMGKDGKTDVTTLNETNNNMLAKSAFEFCLLTYFDQIKSTTWLFL